MPHNVLNVVPGCDQRQAFVTVLDPHVSTRGETGRIVMTVLGMVAQMEPRFIKDRQRKRAGLFENAGLSDIGKYEIR
jgi:DNA invertase Pin-like site-specific DNA recombinase